MNRVIAVFVLACLGMHIPMVAADMRVCSLEGALLLPGYPTYGETDTHKDKCCPNCGETDQGESCCFDLKKLPDTESPSGPLILPALVCGELDVRITVPPCPVVLMKSSHVPATPIRGPDSPGSIRAMLAIWNI